MDTRTNTDLTGKVALITGASRGIGRAIAERFAQHGARLVLGYHRNAKEMLRVEDACRAVGAELVSRAGDICDPETATALCDLAEQHFRGLDILVNNAGVAVEGPLAFLEDEQLKRMVATNILGMVLTTRAALRLMLGNKGGGVILNISSALAGRPGRGNAVYAGTKGFVESFSKAMAVELGRKKIRVNAISPGVIGTDMSRGIRGLAGDGLLERISLRREGTAADVAAMASFLVSEEAAYVTGEVIGVDGGFLGGW